MTEFIPPDGTVLRPLAELKDELSRISAEFYAATNDLTAKHESSTVIAHQAQWHLRGAVFHASALIASYTEFAAGVSARAGVDNEPDALVMYAPMLQEVYFSFYALVNLARITLDNLRLYLQPVFKTPFGQLPKSLSGFLDGNTDCPVYLFLAQQPAVSYLSDLRNCLVHFRSFATGDNAIVIGDHVPAGEEEQLLAEVGWFENMARARFRRTKLGVSVNVFLPDKIFDRSGTAEKLASFTYTERFSIVSQSMAFVRLLREALLSVFSLLDEPGVPTYSFVKRRRPVTS